METRPLAALHNVWQESIPKVIRMGGFAMPSLAVLPADLPFGRFGDVTLVAPLSMVDPRGRSDVQVFSADVYSPRLPEATWSVDRKAIEAVSAALDRARVDLDNAPGVLELHARKGWDEFRDYLLGSAAARLTWLRTVGTEVDIPRVEPAAKGLFSSDGEIRKFYRERSADDLASTEFAEMVQAALDRNLEKLRVNSAKPDAIGELSTLFRRCLAEVTGPEGNLTETEIWRHRDDQAAFLADASSVDNEALRKLLDKALQRAGIRRFANWVELRCAEVCVRPKLRGGAASKPYDLRAVVSAMKREPIRGAETFATPGVGWIRAAAAIRFRTMQEIGDYLSLVVGRDEFEVAKTAVNSTFSQVTGELYSSNAGVDPDAAAFAFTRYLLSGEDGHGSMAATLKVSGFHNVPASLLRRAVGLCREIVAMPTEYFEAKFRRSVQLSEFTCAIVPMDMDDEAAELVERAGLLVVRYTDREDRHAKVERFAKGGSPEALPEVDVPSMKI